MDVPVALDVPEVREAAVDQREQPPQVHPEALPASSSCLSESHTGLPSMQVVFCDVIKIKSSTSGRSSC